MAFKTARVLMAVGAIGVMFGMGMDLYHGTGSCGEYIRGDVTVIFTLGTLIYLQQRNNRLKLNEQPDAISKVEPPIV